MKCPNCEKEIAAKVTKSGAYFFCPDCNIGGKGKTEEAAAVDFAKGLQVNSAPPAPAPINALMLTVPKNRQELTTWAAQNMAILENRAAQFIDKPATKRMIEKNVRYVMNADMKDAWSSPEGQESIVDALSDAIEIGATLPEMGSIIPFGKTVEFIPSINAFTFALTSGMNPPFSSIAIDCVYENDIFEIARKDGNFSFTVSKVGFPRGQVVGVIVMATESGTGRVIGEAYDEKRLMEKAEKHSKNYKYYLADIHALNQARTQGKDYIEKKPGWKLYEKDIQNPYVGADKPEMLKKLAGKSFFAPYMKVRNARAMEAEWKDEDLPAAEQEKKTVNKILDKAVEQVKDADFKVVDHTEEIEGLSVDYGKLKNNLFAD